MAFAPADVASVYIGLFCPRTDAYSAWDAAHEGWRPRREPITPELVVAALRSKAPSMSGYMITTANTSHVLGIDFDRADGLERAHELGKVMWSDGVPAYLEPSRRGAHLWVVIEQPLPAKVVRRAAMSYLDQTPFWMVPDPSQYGRRIPDPKIEIRPGQDEIAPDGLGSPLRLPTMPHPKTGQRYALYRAYGEPLEFPLGATLGEMLLEVQTADPVSIQSAAMRFVPLVDPRHIPKHYREPRAQRDDPWEEAKATDVLRDYWNVPGMLPGRAIRCPAHDDKHPSLSILRDDKRVVCKSPGCILNNDGHGRGTYELAKLSPRGLD